MSGIKLTPVSDKGIMREPQTRHLVLLVLVVTVGADIPQREAG